MFKRPEIFLVSVPISIFLVCCIIALANIFHSNKQLLVDETEYYKQGTIHTISTSNTQICDSIFTRFKDVFTEYEVTTKRITDDTLIFYNEYSFQFDKKDIQTVITYLRNTFQ